MTEKNKLECIQAVADAQFAKTMDLWWRRLSLQVEERLSKMRVYND